LSDHDRSLIRGRSKQGRVVVIEFSGALGLIITLALGALFLNERRQLCKARAAGAALDTVPLTWFCWPAGHERYRDAGRLASYGAFIAGLIPEDAAKLEAARAALQSQGTAFSMPVAACDGGAHTIEGRQTETGAAVLWLLDAAAAASAQNARQEALGLRQMLDAIPVPVWRRGPDLSLVDCNRAYADAIETTPEFAVNEGRELAGGTCSGERRHVVIGGSRRLIEFGEVDCAANGKIGFALDRTDLEAAEAELWRHINAHAQVLEGIRASVAIYGPDRRLKFFNASFASMWALAENWLSAEPSFEEVLERLREDRKLPEVADFRAFKSERLAMFTSLIEPQQEMVHLPDGRALLLSVSPHPFGGLTFVYEDVTDRLALERSCNTLTQVRRATLDHLFEGIAVYGSDGRLKLHNPAYLALWGLSEDDVSEEPHIGEITEKTRALLEDGAFLNDNDWTAIKQRSIAKVTSPALSSGPLYRKDGSMLQEAIVPLPDGNVLLTYLDVTDTTRVERALRERNEALETATRLKSEFIANVSYELRTPLNAVIGFAEILNNQYFGDLNARQLDYSLGILASSQQLLAMINDILDLATIEAGYMVLETARVDIREMLEALLSLTRERARSRNLDIELHCPPDIGTIEADERRLKQATFNLISNSIRFTPPGGTITIEAKRQDGELLLTVADTGIGIPPSDRARMLEKFERGTRQSGAGLGLALVKSLIELHGGTVAIESANGWGTRVICRLPAAPRDLAAGGVRSRQISHGKGAQPRAETKKQPNAAAQVAA
jgi:signal transduction histidine kinase